jgi:peptidoglycan hydrolase CwlO-like protein
MASHYKYYQTLLKRLSAAGFNSRGKYKKFPMNGTIATFLLDLFLKQSESIVKKDILDIHEITVKDDGMTNLFLTYLCEAKFITWSIEDNKEKYNDNWHNYLVYASSELSDILDKEVNQQKATKKEHLELKEEVKNLNTKVQNLEKEIHDLKDCIYKLIDWFDKPVSDKKIEAYINWAKDINSKKENKNG